LQYAPIFIEKYGDRLCFLSYTKCGSTKEDCPHFFLRQLKRIFEPKSEGRIKKKVNRACDRGKVGFLGANVVILNNARH